MNHTEFLKHVPIFSGLSEAQLEKIGASSAIETYNRGEMIFEQNSQGRDVYVILNGEVDLMVDPAELGTIERAASQRRKIASLRTGQSFGEMALIDQKPRSASIAAAQDNTKLMVISKKAFDGTLCDSNYELGYLVTSNIAVDIAEKTRSNVSLIMEQLLTGYYIRVLCEDLIAQNYSCDTINPLHKTAVIRDVDSFILSGAERLVSQVPEKETLDLFFFSTPDLLRQIALPGDPSGEVIFNALFSLLRTGNISERIDCPNFSYQLTPDSQRRSGELFVYKTIDNGPQKFTLQWEIKGTQYNEETNTTLASLFLYLYVDKKSSTHYKVEQIINGIDMPVQKHFTDTLPEKEFDYSKYRVFTIHHRSHEVARTLRTLEALGYELDTFIGVPYGDVDWSTSKMLDAASNYNFNSLQVITHPTEPIQYKFNFAQSSFLDRKDEEQIVATYQDPIISGDYLLAMQALGLYYLEKAINNCLANEQRLLIYEDGAYVVPQIYHIYKDSSHRLHSLFKQAVDERLIVGVVEVTTAGERKDRQAIADNEGVALFPILSSARSDIKTVFEAVGVAEAAIQASATALGRLGLTTFEMRSIGVIGGNGVVGTRIVEQLVRMHNSTGNIYTVSRSDKNFRLEILETDYPYADNRLKYARIERYMVKDSCFPVLLDRAYSERAFEPNLPALREAIDTFLSGGFGDYEEVAITNSYPLSGALLAPLWEELGQKYGYARAGSTNLANDKGISLTFAKEDSSKKVTLLKSPVVLTFPKVARAIRNRIDTVIGITGYSVFNANDLDTFFARENLPGQDDELVLISASSKDYEFKRAIEFLSDLIALQSESGISVEEKLSWFGEWYKQEMYFLPEADFDAIQALLASPLTSKSLQAFSSQSPDLAKAMHLLTGEPTPAKVADFISHKISQTIAVEKDIRPDIGSIYHITVKGKQKRVALLADGLVINFFAKHEKGVRTEFIDPILTMQMLGLIKLTTAESDIEHGLYDLAKKLRAEDMHAFWSAIDDKCRPLTLR